MRAAMSQEWIRLDDLITIGPITPAEAVAPPPPPPPPPPLATRSTVALGAASDDPAIRLVIPVAVEPVALVAGYLGLFSLVLFPAPFALAAGLWALARLKGRSDVHGAGRAWTAIVLGSLGTIGLAVFILSRI